jgi:hypothetical protein
MKSTVPTTTGHLGAVLSTEAKVSTIVALLDVFVVHFDEGAPTRIGGCRRSLHLRRR